jgi:hypothetical protein
MALEIEIARYNELLPELLQQGEHKFVVICGRTLVGVFDTNDAAYQAGLGAVGLAPFLLREILRERPSVFLPSFFVRTKSA